MQGLIGFLLGAIIGGPLVVYIANQGQEIPRGQCFFASLGMGIGLAITASGM